jgi:hypothetical protein
MALKMMRHAAPRVPGSLARWGEVRISSDALSLVVSFGTRVHRCLADGIAEPTVCEMPESAELFDSGDRLRAAWG